MRHCFALAAVAAVCSGLLLVAACVGEDPAANDGSGDGGGSSGTSGTSGTSGSSGSSGSSGTSGTSGSSGSSGASSSGDGGGDAGPKCGYPGEDCCAQPPACRLGTQCALTSNRCVANDIWVVGYRLISLQPTGVSIHYDGLSWKEGPFVGSSAVGEIPTDVWGLGPGAYRAVNTAGDAVILANFVGSDVWDVCNNSNCPDPNTTKNLSSIFGFANNDYWIAGNSVMFQCTNATCTSRDAGLPTTFSDGRLGGTSSKDLWYPGGTKAFHYDGGGVWGTMPNVQATAIWAWKANDVWAGGTQLQHYDGNTWSAPMNIGTAPAPGQIHSISGSATDDVWAIGETNGSLPFVAHWNGTAWSDVPIPAAAEQLGNVWAISKTEAYLTSLFHGVYKWDGAAWTLMPAPNQSNGNPVLQAYYAVSGSARPRP